MNAKRFGLSDSDLNIIRKCIKEIPDIKKTFIFGSRALGTFRPASDIDIAIICGQNGFIALRDLSTKLNQEIPLPYKFDVVLYSDALDPNFKAHIDRFGIEI